MNTAPVGRQGSPRLKRHPAVPRALIDSVSDVIGCPNGIHRVLALSSVSGDGEYSGVMQACASSWAKSFSWR
jgi:hypothetical protein